MAPLRLRLTLWSLLLALLLASCAGFPAAHPPQAGVPDPHETDSLTLEARGILLHAFTQGPGDADILVIGIHGWAASGAEWLVFGEALRERSERARQADGKAGVPSRSPTVRLVSPDLPGSGASGKPDAPYTPVWFVQVLEDLRKALGRERIVLAGHSLGGRIALEYALRYPEHTEALILLAPAGLSESFRDLDRWALERGGVARAASAFVTEGAYRSFYRRRVVHDPRYAYPGILQWALDGLFTPEGQRAFRAVTRNTLAAPDLSDRLAQVPAPVLLVWGRDDEVLRFETSQAYTSRLPDLRGFLALDGCGHLPHTERAAETARAAYEFLRSL